MNIHIIQHVAFEPPGFITEWAKDHNHRITHSFLFDINIDWPKSPEYDLLVILGGPMGVGEEDRFGWLKAEKNFIRQAIIDNKRILGICLGAQLLAQALGATVYPNPEKEIGFFPVIKTNEGRADKLFSHIPEIWNVFHWHGDTFDLPNGASLLYSSPACRQQVFRKGNWVGIQFHPEVDTALLKSMITNERDELIMAEYIQSEEDILRKDITIENKQYFYDLLTKMLP